MGYTGQPCAVLCTAPSSRSRVGTISAGCTSSQAPTRRPRTCQQRHEQTNEQLYADGTGVERTDKPLVMTVGSAHATVHGAPADTLAASTVLNPPTLRAVRLATADRATQLLELTERRAGW